MKYLSSSCALFCFQLEKFESEGKGKTMERVFLIFEVMSHDSAKCLYDIDGASLIHTKEAMKYTFSFNSENESFNFISTTLQASL